MLSRLHMQVFAPGATLAHICAGNAQMRKWGFANVQWAKFVSQNSPAVHRFDCCEDGRWTIQGDAGHKTIFLCLLVLGAYHDNHYPRECRHTVVNDQNQINVNKSLFREECQREECGDGAQEH